MAQSQNSIANTIGGAIMLVVILGLGASCAHRAIFRNDPRYVQERAEEASRKTAMEVAAARDKERHEAHLAGLRAATEASKERSRKARADCEARLDWAECEEIYNPTDKQRQQRDREQQIGMQVSDRANEMLAQ